MTATIRWGSADDARALARLRWNWRLDRGEVPAGDLDAFTADLRGWIEGHAASHLPAVAEVEGEVVGMAWLAVVERIPGPGVWTRLSGYLQSVYVEPPHRDGGLGARLVGVVIDEARSRGLDYLAVHPSERSMPFYRRLGFQEYERALELRFT